MARKKLDPASLTPLAGVDQVLSHDRICWFPVRHFSPASAHHVKEVIEALQPDAVLVEGPDDATPQIDALVHPDTHPPVSVLSTWVDKRNVHQQNGRLTPSPEVPARFRGWWPFVSYSPEYVALTTGRSVGAELAFIDAPLPATVGFHQVRDGTITAAVNDRNLAEGAYFRALGDRQRRASFDAFWQANFEVRGVRTDTLDWMRAVLTFAWCTRHVGSPAAFDLDGTHVREQHMRWHVDQARKRHKGWIVVVTGAFHSVALPFTRGKRARAKADRYTTTLLCGHSYPALARLYGQNRSPAYGRSVWTAVNEDHPRPHAVAGRQLLVEVMRAGRERGLPMNTADAVGAWRVALELAALRGDADPGLAELLDAIQMTYVKGDLRTAGAPVTLVTRSVLVGRRMGSVTATAGQVPLLSSFYDEARSHRLDVSGAHKVVRCDLGKSAAHRRKSGFLHCADFLDLPLFDSADKKRGRAEHFRGPDPVTGENLHLITESWGIRWQETVDDRLVELADRGGSLAEVATGQIREDLTIANGDVVATVALLLRSAQMQLLDAFPVTLEAVNAALRIDRRFSSLAGALDDFTALYDLRRGLAERDVERMLDTIEATWTAAVLQVHQLAAVDDEGVREAVHHLQDVLRLAIGFEDRALDLSLLAERLEDLASNEGCRPGVRGAVVGALYGLGHRRESDIADELRLRLAGVHASDCGPFLEGVFVNGRSVLLGGSHLLAAIDDVLAELDWEAFRTLLPDLRRAFTQFIPSEIDQISSAVSAHIGLWTPPDRDVPVPAGLYAWVHEADARACEAVRRTQKRSPQQ